MKLLNISYDLRAPGRDYEGLYRAIRQIGYRATHPLESVWLVVTNQSAAIVRDRLLRHLDRNDQLLVTEVGTQWAAYGINADALQSMAV